MKLKDVNKILILVGLVFVCFLDPMNGSVDKQREACRNNHYLRSKGTSISDTLPKITRADVAGVWLYRSIDTFHQGLGQGSNRIPGGIHTTKSPTPLTLTPTDTMRILENGPFFYHIGAINKKAWGRARIETCELPFCQTGYQLALYYEEGSTTNSLIRKFRIQHFSGDSLVIQEGNTYFRYSRRK